MDKNEINKYIGEMTIPLAIAMQQIDANGGGVIFLIDEKNILYGSVSDGDIRRFLLAGGQIKDMAYKAANKQPKMAYTVDDAKVLYHSKNYVAIPIINKEGTIIDIYTGNGNMMKKKASLDIPVVINAGGKGTRLDPFTRVLPKPLIPVGELPILEHIMKEFQSYDCDKFHIIVNYKRELIKAYFSEIDSNYDITWYNEEMPLNTGGGLSLLKGKITNTFFFTNCDNLLTANYERMLQFHKENNNVITMICAYKNFSIPYGVIEMGVNGKINGMQEKPLMSFLTNTGIYIVEPEVIDDIETGVAIGFPDIIDKQRQRGRKVAVFPISENDWMDMGQISELEKMRKQLYGE